MIPHRTAGTHDTPPPHARAAHRPSLAHPLLLAALALALAACSGKTYDGPVEGERALAHAREIVARSPRPPGSPGIVKVRDYLEQQIRALGLEPRRDEWREEKEGVPMCNVWTEIPGQDPKDGPIMVIGAHYDSKLAHGHEDPAHNFEFVGAVDAAGACGVLLELGRVLKDRQNVPTIWLVWFDGEESFPWDWGAGERALYGSKHFVEVMANDKQRFPHGLSARMKVMVLLDLVGAKDFKVDRDAWSQEDLLRIFKESAARLGEEHRMYKYESKMTDDHIPFQQRGVSVIDLIDLLGRDPTQKQPPGESYLQYWHTKEDTLDKLSADGLEFFGDLVWHALPAIEKDFYKKR